ncbi:MAG TPA: LLM class flavin-dependent oxidoreductase [Dehalococcoidia bacterium]|nr:LLM class flavin-dependent oxidoreductase [Dehalococcoidia bacterium]
MMPAISLAAVAGRRKATIELARELERRGYAGIYLPSFGDAMGLAVAIALSTERIPFGTTVQPIYLRQPSDFASQASLIHELSGGRFHFGIGVTHGPVQQRLGVTPGKPLSDIRRFVERVRKAAEQGAGELPPIVLAAMRYKMIDLAAEIAEGCVFANGARSHMAASLGHLPAEKREGGPFFIGDMIPTCIAEDRDAAAAVMRRTLTGYVMLPNYRNYWLEAGYEEEMRAIERAQQSGDAAKIPGLMSERWLQDVTLYGTASDVKDGLEAWLAAGVKTPILVPSSASGGQMKAFEELFAAFG